MRDDQVYLRHIRDAIDSILEYTAGGQEQFSRNKMMQDAVVRNLEIIGEAVKNLSSGLRTRHPTVPWQQIAGLRDVLIHQYFGVNLELVWQVVEQRLPELRRLVVRLIEEGE
jgi:uncharacterized protein with HEPN domain